jgi:hypothetical protein
MPNLALVGCSAAPIRGAAFASLQALVRLVRAPVDLMGANAAGVNSDQQRIRPFDNHKTTARLLETRDNRVASCCVVFRCMPTWRIIAAADATTFGASAKMQPPTAGRQAFNTAGTTRLGRGINTRSLRRHVASGVVCAASLPPRSLRNRSRKFLARHRYLSASGALQSDRVSGCAPSMAEAHRS